MASHDGGERRTGCTSILAWWLTYLVIAPVRMLYPAPDKLKAGQKLPGFWFLSVTVAMAWIALFFLALSATVSWLVTDASWWEGFAANARRWWLLLVAVWLIIAIRKPKLERTDAAPLRLHWFQHVDFEGLGLIAEWAAERGCIVSRTAWQEPGAAPPDRDEIDLLVVMGGSMGVDDEDRYPWLVQEKIWLQRYFASGKPVLGICLGAQMLADALGGEVKANEHMEIGWFPVARAENPGDPLVAMFPEEFTPLHWHAQTFSVPEGAEPFGSSEATANQGFAMDGRLLGLQFHPEMGEAQLRDAIEGGHVGSDPEGQFVQSADAILAGVGEHGEACRKHLYHVLDWLAAKAVEAREL